MSEAILLVDDVQYSRQILAGFIAARGFAVLEANTGDAALLELEKSHEKVQACILDLQLLGSDLSGIETLQQMRKSYPDIPVLVFTAYEDDGEEAANSGATLFVKKPFEPTHLSVMVDAMVNMRRLKRKVAIEETARDVLQRTIDAMEVEVMLIDGDHNVLAINATKRRNCNLPDPLPAKQACWDLVCKRKDACDGCDLATSNNNGQFHLREMAIGDRSFLVRLAPVADESEKLKFYVQTAVDVTRRKQATELMLKLFKMVDKGPDEIIEFVADWLHERMRYQRVRIYLHYADEPDSVKGATCRGMPKDVSFKGKVLTKGDVFLRKYVFDLERPILITGQDLKDGHDSCFESLHKEGVRFQVQAPLRSTQAPLRAAQGPTRADQQLIGVISIDDKGAFEPLTLEDLDVISLLGTVVADAISAARTQNQDRVNLKWLDSLRKIDHELATSTSTSEILDILIESVKGLTDADAGIVMTRSRRDDDKLLHVAAIANGTPADVREVIHSGEYGIIGEAIQKRGLVISGDLPNDDRFKSCLAKMLAEHGKDIWTRFVTPMRSGLVQPVLIDDTLIGALVLFSTKPHKFSWDRQVFLDGLSRRVAIALAKLEEAQRIEAAALQRAQLSDLALMSTGVAHSVKTPLTSIRGSLDEAKLGVAAMSAADPNWQAQVMVYLRAIESPLDRAFSTIERLVQWIRPLGMTPCSVNVNQLLEELKELVNEEFRRRRIDCDLRLPRLPATAYVSPDGLRVALVDMFWNAYKAMPHGGHLEIEVHVDTSNNKTQIQIRDNGVGMSAQQIKRLLTYDPYDPLPAGGAGLGLYLARKFIQAAKGKLEGESIVDGGTTFRIILPSEKQL